LSESEENQLQLDDIIDWVDGAFGATPALPGGESFRAVLASGEYQRFLQDQVNRQVIRDYLANAVLLGVIAEGGLAAFAHPMASEEGRGALALHMLMNSVDDAMELPLASGEAEVLQPLERRPQDHPHIKLVPN
jgi:hypothetical protein